MVLWFVGAMLIKLLVLTAIVLVVYKLVVYVDSRRGSSMSERDKGPGRAVGIVRERYASGEINESEYHRLIQVLRSSESGT